LAFSVLGKPALWSSVPENLISTHFPVLEVGSQDFGTLLSGVDFNGQSTGLQSRFAVARGFWQHVANVWPTEYLLSACASHLNAHQILKPTR